MIDDTNIIYDFHMYRPHSFTHQRTQGPIIEKWPSLLREPGWFDLTDLHVGGEVRSPELKEYPLEIAFRYNKECSYCIKLDFDTIKVNLILSGFFDETRDEYYRLLLSVCQKGNWREWVEYFLRGVRLQSERALEDTQHVLTLYEVYRLKLKQGKRVPQEAARVLDQIFANPFISITRYRNRNKVSYHNARNGVEFWIGQGLLKEVTGQRRNRIYMAEEVFRIMAGPSSPNDGGTSSTDSEEESTGS